MAKSWGCPMCGRLNKNRRDVCSVCCTRRDEYVPDRTPVDPDVLKTAKVVSAAFAGRSSMLELRIPRSFEQYREAFEYAFRSND